MYAFRIGTFPYSVSNWLGLVPSRRNLTICPDNHCNFGIFMNCQRSCGFCCSWHLTSFGSLSGEGTQLFYVVLMAETGVSTHVIHMLFKFCKSYCGQSGWIRKIWPMACKLGSDDIKSLHATISLQTKNVKSEETKQQDWRKLQLLLRPLPNFELWLHSERSKKSSSSSALRNSWNFIQKWRKQ